MNDKRLQCRYYIKPSFLLERKKHMHTRAEKTTQATVCSIPQPEVSVRQMFN